MVHSANVAVMSLRSLQSRTANYRSSVAHWMFDNRCATYAFEITIPSRPFGVTLDGPTCVTLSRKKSAQEH